MSTINKIEKYGLTDRILALQGQGKPTQEIADIVSGELEGDNISQSAVSRYLKKVRVERKEAADQVITEYVKAELTGDLDMLKMMKQDYLSFRNTCLGVLTGKVVAEISPNGVIVYDLKTLMTLDDKLHELIKTTLRFVGADGGDDGEKRHPVDLSKYKKQLDDIMSSKQEAEGRDG